MLSFCFVEQMNIRERIEKCKEEMKRDSNVRAKGKQVHSSVSLKSA
jgi:hypothetical protein